jgi:hypothetical protein
MATGVVLRLGKASIAAKSFRSPRDEDSTIRLDHLQTLARAIID